MSAAAVARLSEWTSKGKWDDLFQQTLEDHVGLVLDEYDLSYEELREAVGENIYYMVLGAAFEDFLTLRVEGETPVDAFLRSEGKGEERSAKEYLRGLRDSIASIYKVISLTDDGFVVADLVRGGETMVNIDGLDNDAVGTAFIARVIETTGTRTFNPARLPLELDEAEALLDVIKEAMESEAKGRKVRGPLSGRTMDDALAEVADVLTGEWLDLVLGPIGLETMPSVPVRFVVTEDRQEAVRERLNRATQLVRAGESAWMWFPFNRPGVDPMEGDGVAGNVVLNEEGLTLDAQVSEDLLVGQGYLMGVLDGLVGLPELADPSLLADLLDETE